MNQITRLISKIFLFFLLVFSSFANEIPDDFLGIWESEDRYVFFEENSVLNEENQNSYAVIILKEYYGWYLDRASESLEISQKYLRDKNAAISSNAQIIPFEFTKNVQNTCEIIFSFSNREKNIIPVAIIDDKMYLKFYIKSQNEIQSENSKNSASFWAGNMVSEGFKISQRNDDEKLSCLLISGEKVYDIRYWKTDMEYNPFDVKFICEDGTFEIPSHIQSGGKNFTCVNGRSKKVRNVMKAKSLLELDAVFNEENTVLAVENPYLVKLLDGNTLEYLISIVNNQNSKRKPDPPPLFPDMQVDFHWDLIDVLEKDNEIIQKVRERQKEFGLRGKDIGK